jgi:hypothetical protein
MNNELQEVLKAKEELCKERDLCAELYNVWISKLHDYQHDKEKYDLYMRMINNMEPYGQIVKEQIREMNRKICEIEGAESIGDTEHMVGCVAKYGFDAPNTKV